MPEFIPRRNYPQGLAQLLVEQTGQQSDPFASASQGLRSTVMNLLGSIQERESKRENLTSLLAKEGLLHAGPLTGTVNRGKKIWDQGIPLSEVFPSAGFDSKSGLALRTTPKLPEREFEKVEVTPEMTKLYPGLVVGSKVPSTFMADLESKKVGVGREAGRHEQNIANQLRDELNKMSGDFDKVTKSYSDILAVTKKPSAAGDLSLIFSYMKMLDPASTVREGEQATAENARGIPATIRAQYNKVMVGEKLAPEQRMDFLNQSHNLYSSQEGIQRDREETYRGLAERNRIDPANVIVPRGIRQVKPKPLAAIAQGDVVTIVDSTGKEHQILSKNIDAAKKRDPQLKVKGE